MGSCYNIRGKLRGNYKWDTCSNIRGILSGIIMKHICVSPPAWECLCMYSPAWNTYVTTWETCNTIWGHSLLIIGTNLLQLCCSLLLAYSIATYDPSLYIIHGVIILCPLLYHVSSSAALKSVHVCTATPVDMSMSLFIPKSSSVDTLLHVT